MVYTKPLHNFVEEDIPRASGETKGNFQMQPVLVIAQKEQPLMPCHPARGQELLKKGKSAVFRRYPFPIILKEREGGEMHPIALKIDPGSKRAAIALVAEGKQGEQALIPPPA